MKQKRSVKKKTRTKLLFFLTQYIALHSIFIFLNCVLVLMEYFSRQFIFVMAISELWHVAVSKLLGCKKVSKRHLTFVINNPSKLFKGCTRNLAIKAVPKWSMCCLQSFCLTMWLRQSLFLQSGRCMIYFRQNSCIFNTPHQFVKLTLACHCSLINHSSKAI